MAKANIVEWGLQLSEPLPWACEWPGTGHGQLDGGCVGHIRGCHCNELKHQPTAVRTCSLTGSLSGESPLGSHPGCCSTFGKAACTGPLNTCPVQVIVEKMIDYLRNVSDEVIKADVVQRIGELVERFAPDTQWFIDTMNQVGAGGVPSSTPPNGLHNFLQRLVVQGLKQPYRWRQDAM